MTVPRMRTIAEAHKMLKELDPDTAITISRIRKMVNNNDVKNCRAGRRILLNFDDLLDRLANGDQTPPENIAQNPERIRRIG